MYRFSIFSVLVFSFWISGYTQELSDNLKVKDDSNKAITIQQDLPSKAKPLVLVYIKPGEFMMGSPKNEKDKMVGEVPRHHVTLTKGFYIGKYEVTNAQFRSYKPSHNSKDYRGLSLDADNQPVIGVSWNDADAYCKWLTQQKRGWIFRLPTEAEWEYACRAGTTERRYWGDDLNDDQACSYENVRDIAYMNNERNFIGRHFKCKDGYVESSPVGMFQPNNFGLHDMLGNVREWCLDWFSSYSETDKIDPIKSKKMVLNNKESLACRVVRGGSFNDSPEKVRAAFRIGGKPDYAEYFGGFRIVGIRHK